MVRAMRKEAGVNLMSVEWYVNDPLKSKFEDNIIIFLELLRVAQCVKLIEVQHLPFQDFFFCQIKIANGTLT